MTTFTRDELERILAVRAGTPEWQGEHAWLEFRFRITPELLAEIMDSELVTPKGVRCRIKSIYIDEGNLAVPVLEPV